MERLQRRSEHLRVCEQRIFSDVTPGRLDCPSKLVSAWSSDGFHSSVANLDFNNLGTVTYTGNTMTATGQLDTTGNICMTCGGGRTITTITGAFTFSNNVILLTVPGVYTGSEFSYNFCMEGISALHGPHQVAQKLTNKTLP